MSDETNIQPEFQRRLAHAIDAGALLRPGARVLVGVSGGLDSVVLLHALAAVANDPQRGYSLIVAHLDHGLREASADDAAFVAELAREYSLPCVVERAAVQSLAQEQGQGVEHAARMARYDFFARVAREQQADAIAAAHHADDNVETILFRILRGTGMRGLKGMDVKRELREEVRSAECEVRSEEQEQGPGSGKREEERSRTTYYELRTIFLIRPLLGFRRDEILTYAQATNLAWREDHTNDDTQYRRNFLRHELLPLVREKLNDQADAAVLRLGQLAAQTELFLQQQAEGRLVRAISYEDSGKILLDVTMFAPDPSDDVEAILRTTAYRKILERLGMGQRDMTAEHLSAIDALLRLPRGVVNLPEGLTVKRERSQLVFQLQKVRSA